MSEPTDPTTPPEPMQERAAGIAQLMKDVHDFGVSAKAKTHAVVAERMFDAMCCGAKAADLPFLATDRPMTLALIDLLFAKLADTREADAIEVAGDEPSKLNVNTQVWVRLTGIGTDVAARAGFATYDPALKRARVPKPGEWCCDTIWRLMHYFGANCFMGAPQVFVDNEIVLTDPTTKAAGEPRVTAPMAPTIDEWVAANPVKPTMIYHNGAVRQFDTWRECEHSVSILTGSVRVIGDHMSKSIKLPVVEVIDTAVGLRVVMRDNFHDLSVTVESEHPIPLVLPDEWHAATAVSGYGFEGFEGAGVRVYDAPAPRGPYRRFSFTASRRARPAEIVTHLRDEAARASAAL